MGTTTTTRTRSWWGWGYEDQAVGRDEMLATAGRLAERFGRDIETIDPPRVADLDLRAPRVDVPVAFADWCSTAPIDRAGHTYGKSYRDIVRAVHGDLPEPARRRRLPADRGRRRRPARLVLVGRRSPRSPTAAGRPSSAGWSAPSATVRRRRLDRPRRASTGSSRSIPCRRAARIQAGALGPVLEEQLRPHGYTLRHFPQSFEFSTLGGWLATRSGGHYASVYTHIDDLVESMRVVTPDRRQRVPPAARLRRRAVARPPVPRLGGRARRSSPRRGCACRTDHGGGRGRRRVRRLRRRGGGDAGGRPVRAVPDELPAPRRPARRRRRPERRTSARCSSSASSRPTIPSARGSTGPSSCAATTAARFLPASAPPTAPTAATRERDDAVGSWRSSFLRAPYLRDALVCCGMLVETFETACTWDAFDELTARAPRRSPTPCSGSAAAGGDLPVHPRLPGRPGAVLLDHRARPDRLGAGHVGRDQGGRLGGAAGRRRHDHPSPRRRPRPRPVVRRQRPAPFGRALRRSRRSSTRPASSTRG